MTGLIFGGNSFETAFVMDKPRKKQVSPATVQSKQQKASTQAGQVSGKHKLALFFEGASAPVLTRIEFTPRDAESPVFWEANHRSYYFKWTKVTQALTLLFLEYVEWGKSKPDEDFYFEGKAHKSPAGSIGDAISKKSISLYKIFSRDRLETTSLVGDIFLSGCGGNTHGRGISARTRRIPINANFLPSKNVEIFWQKNDSDNPRTSAGLKQVRALLNLFQAKLGQPVKKWPGEVLTIEPTAQSAIVDEDKYAEAICSRYGMIPLEAFAPNEALHQAVGLFKVFEPQKVRACQEILPIALEDTKENLQSHRLSSHSDKIIQSGFKKTNAPDQARRQYFKQESLGVAEVLDSNRYARIVFLGAGGAGKSSLVQYQLVRWALTAVRIRRELELPVLIELQAYAQSRLNREGVFDFLDYLEHGSGTFWRFAKDKLKDRLQAGKIAVYFDGLDEIMDCAMREEIITGILRFAAEHSKVQIVLTSRPIGYTGSFRRAGFHHFMIEDFTAKQIFEVAQRWHNETQPNDRTPHADAELKKFVKIITESDSLREIAGNPLMLTLLLLLGGKQELPNSKAEIYERCADLILGHWKVDKTITSDPDLKGLAILIGLREKKTILHDLARQMTAQDDALANSISIEKLEAVIARSLKRMMPSSPQAAVRALVNHLRERCGILCRIDANRYGFVHRGFLEYFLADSLRQRFEDGSVLDDIREMPKTFSQRADDGSREALWLFLGIASDPDNGKAEFGHRWIDSSWSETLCLFCSMADPGLVSMLLNHFLNHHEDYYDKSDAVLFAAKCLKEAKARNKIDEKLLFRMQKELLAILNCPPPEIIPWPTFPPNTPRWARDMMIDHLNFSQHDDEDKFISNTQNSINLLGELFSEDDKVAKHLNKLIKSRASYTVKTAAFDVFIQRWTSHPKFREWLQNFAEENEGDWIRIAALTELARRWNDPLILEFLKRRAEVDASPEVRQVAAREANNILNKSPGQ